MALAQYYQTRSKKTHRPISLYVRLIMTPEEHRDMLVAIQLSCHLIVKPETDSERDYLSRLRTIYDQTFKPEEVAL